MVKPEEFDYLHLVYYFAVPLISQVGSEEELLYLENKLIFNRRFLTSITYSFCHLIAEL